MRVVLLIGALLALWLAPVPAHAQPFDFSAVDDAVRDVVATGEIPGAVVLVGQGDRVLYHRAFGLRQVVPTPEPMTEDTVFDIASLTKPLGTTLAVMSLVERNRIRLDAPLGAYLREFRRRAFSQVTIRRMLAHRAGFPAVPPDTAVRAGFPRAARALATIALDYPPGTGFQYSDMGFILLGEVVRRVSGDPLDRYLRRHLFRPLGLRDTTYRPDGDLRPRIAPTEFFNGRLLRGEVHDPRARRLGGVAGHAGMFSSARDLARICRMLVDGGSLEGRHVLRASTVRAMWTPWPNPDSPRGLGWDVSSPYAAPMYLFFPAGSVGHTGFTGTSVWIDPATRTYLILLTNRVHPNGNGAGRIRELRARVTAAVGAALFQGPEPPPFTPMSTNPEPSGPAADAPALSAGAVLTGLDALVRQNFALLAGTSVGLITNQTGVDMARHRAIDLFAAAPNLTLKAVFSPEHGLNGDATTDVPNSVDAVTGRPVWSLYGSTRRPTPEMLQGVTALVYDIQDVGVRYYTYLTTLVYAMEQAARFNIPVYVLDRPNPITGRFVEGPLMDPDLRSFTAPHTIPVRTGLTVGEFARLAAVEQHIPVTLTVVPLTNWDRAQWFDETGLPWTNPSPNIRSVTQALLYSGVGLLEATNLSVGRGTDAPFEVVGAPWIEPYGLADALNRLALPGVRFGPVWFTPAADIYATIQCAGVRLLVTNRDTIRPVTVALALARELRARHRDQYKPELIQNLLVNRSTMWAILRNEPLERLTAWAEMERESFLKRRASALIYH
jgi:uncharacterized protein YbbC (DUF1343 family)/CubicO group peptidase (beta-lactamase class C family)